MKYTMSCIGLMIIVFGCAGFDSNMAIGTAIILIGLCITVPFMRMYDDEEEINERHNRRNKK